MPNYDIDQILAHLRPEGDCLVYTKRISSHGYGRVARTIDGKQRDFATHRLIYEHFHGPIPDGMDVMHTCDNRPCGNIEHLRLGSRKENLADMTKKGRRGRRGYGLDVANEVRARYASGERAYALAEELGISVATVYNYLNRKHWIR